MGININRVKLNPAILVSGMATVFSGLLIQVKYHMGNHGNLTINDHVFGINYKSWSDIHKISVVVLSALMIYHIYRHRKWYKVVILKKRIMKNSQVIILSVIFMLVAITGYIPWLINLLEDDVITRKVFIEIHDKLAIILSLYLILHVIRRRKSI